MEMINYLKKNTFNNISAFLCTNKCLYIYDNRCKNISCINLEMYKEIWHYTYEASYVLLAKYKDSILISDGDNSVQLDLESGNEITTSTSLGYTFIFHTEFSELIVVCKSYSILSGIYGVYSFITNRILFWSNDIRLVRIFGELIINKTENDIYSLDKFGEKIWHFTPQSLKKVYPEKMEKYGENKVKINHFVGVSTRCELVYVKI